MIDRRTLVTNIVLIVAVVYFIIAVIVVEF